MKYVVTDEDVELACETYYGRGLYTKWSSFDDVARNFQRQSMRAAIEAFAQTLGEPVAVPDARSEYLGGEYASGWNACREAMLTQGNSLARDDLYRQACDSVEEWKQRALEAERAIESIRNEMSPTHMGEPVLNGLPHVWKFHSKSGITMCRLCSAQKSSKRGNTPCVGPEAAPHHPTTEKGCE